MHSGYMAPEYAMHGNFSVKSDVFSFGVLVLEIVSGQRNNLFQAGNNTEVLISYVSIRTYFFYFAYCFKDQSTQCLSYVCRFGRIGGKEQYQISLIPV